MPLTELTANQGDAGTQPWPVVIDHASTATRSAVPASNTVVPLLAANPNRTGFVVYNDSGKQLSLILGTGGGIADFTVLLNSKATYEREGFTGEVNGIWNGTGGSARVTEFTI